MYVCMCNALTDKEIALAAREGAKDVDDAYRMLGAEVCCGECYCLAEEVIESTVASPANTRPMSDCALQAAE